MRNCSADVKPQRSTYNPTDHRSKVGPIGLSDNRDDESDDGVHSPVGGGGDGHTLGGQSGRESLSRHNPSNRTPSACKGGDKDTREGDENLSGNILSRPRGMSRIGVKIRVEDVDGKHIELTGNVQRNQQ